MAKDKTNKREGYPNGTPAIIIILHKLIIMVLYNLIWLLIGPFWFFKRSGGILFSVLRLGHILAYIILIFIFLIVKPFENWCSYPADFVNSHQSRINFRNRLPLLCIGIFFTAANIYLLRHTEIFTGSQFQKLIEPVLGTLNIVINFYAKFGLELNITLDISGVFWVINGVAMCIGSLVGPGMILCPKCKRYTVEE